MVERGSIYIASEKGTLTRKPRPVLIIQNERVNSFYTTVTACLISASVSGMANVRVLVAPTLGNGLKEPSEVQADRIVTYQRESLDDFVGRLSPDDLRRVDLAVRRWLDL